MKQKKIITFSIIIFGLLMMGFSIYLTKHFFDLKFPTGLEGKSLCNVNQFFNCDKTTLSKLSSVFGIPISLFGVLIGAISLLGQFSKNQNYKQTAYFSLLINFFGCVCLFTYSLVILKGLCPFCTLYYLSSGLVLFLYSKKYPAITPKPALNVLLLFIIIALVMIGITKTYSQRKTITNSIVSSDIIKQFYSLTNSGIPKVISSFKISDVPDAPIKLTIFSDFECPTCRVFSEMIPQIVSRYNGKIDIQYFFYPLDINCNPNVKRKIHLYACKAAFAASCMPTQDFAKTHDDLFQNQDKFETGYLDQFIKDHHLLACVTDPKTKEKVLSLIDAAKPYQLKVTPTFLINGVKIEGVIPTGPLFEIFDEIIRKSRMSL